MNLTKRLLPLFALAGMATGASAHVTVSPKASNAGAWEKYDIRLPNEKDSGTTMLEVRFPAGLRVMSFEEKPGWTVQTLRDANGTITGARWSGQLSPQRFVEFGVIAVNPNGSELIWTAVQTYADGTTVSWSGAPGSKTPAPRVKLRPPSR
jgi:uncharacterized protein YcnI